MTSRTWQTAALVSCALLLAGCSGMTFSILQSERDPAQEAAIRACDLKRANDENVVDEGGSSSGGSGKWIAPTLGDDSWNQGDPLAHLQDLANVWASRAADAVEARMLDSKWQSLAQPTERLAEMSARVVEDRKRGALNNYRHDWSYLEDYNPNLRKRTTECAALASILNK
jgi:hypothetical protein